MRTHFGTHIRRLSVIFSVLAVHFFQASGAELRLPEVGFFVDSGVERVVEDTGGTFTVEVGIPSGYTESSFVTSVNSTLSSSNWYWLSLTDFTLTTSQTGIATFSVSAWLEYSDFLFTLLDSSGSSNVPVRQLCRADHWIENTDTRGVYYGKPDSLVLSSTISGAIYTIMCGGTAVSTVTGTGSRMSVPVSGPGTFTVECPSGRVRGSMTLELYSFLRKVQFSPDYNPVSLPSGSYSNVIFLWVLDGETVSRSELEEMLAAYSSGSVSYWGSGVRLSVSSWSDSMVVLQYECDPNLSSSARTLDTRILVSGGTLTFTQEGGGTLETYVVSGESNVGSPYGKVHLDGSQSGVEYVLHRADGYPVSTLMGTGSALTFEDVPGSAYTVTAYAGTASLAMSGEAVVLTRPEGTSSANSIRTLAILDSSGKTGMTDILYYDGIGGLSQHVSVHASGLSSSTTGLERDLVTPVYRDALWRSDAREHLPFAPLSHDGGFVTDPFAAQSAFHQETHSDSLAYSVLIREASPLARPLSATRPGTECRSPSARAVVYVYGSNSADDAVTRWVVASSTSVSAGGTYPAGTLSKTAVTDEDGRTVILFADSDGRTILERRSVSSGVTADTYRVYDARDSLVWVIPPACVSSLGTSRTLTAGEGLAASYCHVYTYDAQGNVLSHDRPGAGRTEYGYDAAGRMISMQDELMRSDGRIRTWTYDALGRETSVMESSGSGQASVLSETFYDAYPTAASPFVSESGYTSSYDSRTKGLVTFSRLSVEGRTDFRTRTFYYDAKGNVIQRVESDGLGVLRVSTAYSFTGNPVKSRETYVPSGSLSGDTVERTWTYDLRDRLSEETVRVNSGEIVTISYAYDALGRPSGSTVSSSGASLSSSVTLDLQGRERIRTVTAGGTRLFGSELRYHDAELTGSTAQYSGCISEWEWSRGTASPKAYSFSYDGLSRLTGSALYEDGTKTDRFTESGMTYDLNGNMTSLTRTVGSVPTTFSSSYSGNRRSGYSYDANGNVVEDSFSGLSLQWNRCGRIQKVSSGGTVLVNYSYLSDGIKVSALRSDGSGLMYVGSLTYRCEKGLPVSLEEVSFNGGRFVASSDSSGGITMTPHFYSTDHLGSVRAVTDCVTGEVLETSDYYPFGGRWDDSTSQTAAENRYRYNGKEEQATFGTPYSDYGARQYSAATCRWLAIDPLAEKHYNVSPYAFCNNNPVNFVDPDGRFPDIIWDVASIGMGISNLVQNVQSGNVRGAVGDGVGIVIDAVAAAVPFIPGGVGAVRAGTKAVNAIDNAADATKAARTADGINDVANNTGTVSATTRGRINEKRVLNDLELTKNTTTVQGRTNTGELRGTIPDAIMSDTVYEVKDVQNLSNTKQIQAQINYAQEKGLNYRIITGTNTHVSGNIPNEYIIRLDYLGPQH